MRKIRQILEFLIIKTLFIIIKMMPHTMLFYVSSFLGLFVFMIPAVRKLVSANIHATFPEKEKGEVKTIAKASINNLIQSFIEFAWFSNSPYRLQKHFQPPLKINELAKEKTKDNNGFIYVVPHLGNWELAGLIFSKVCDQPFAAVARKLDNPYLNKLLIAHRESEGTQIIPAKGAVKGMLRALGQGCVVATLIDQNTRLRDGGIWTKFFGMSVPASRAPAMFARKRNCEIAVGGCVRQGKKYITFTEELPKKVCDYESDTDIINDLMAATENVVRKYPEQYLWLYKRFQHIPETATEADVARYPSYAEKVTPRFYDVRVPKEQNNFKPTSS